ncbi:MAG: DegV family protein [Anaerolineae bacterium]|nr:DegV family protein [Anaerolineae bacterium]
MAIKLVTDSTAYLPEEMIRRLDIRVVPLCVHFAHEEFKEGVELSNEEFYKRLQEAAQLPTTSQPSAGAFFEVFKELADKGHEIVAITISSKLSGTWNSAMAAREMLPEAGISIIDSLSTSIGLRHMIEAAGRAIASGATREETVAKIEKVKESTYLLFVVDTLEYLAKGGRIGNAKAFLGTLLKVKPILILKDGAIEPLEQVRSKRKAHARMIELIENHVAANGSDIQVSLVHALVPEDAQALAQELSARLGDVPVSINDLGPVIGTHTGPGVVGVAVSLS